MPFNRCEINWIENARYSDPNALSLRSHSANMSIQSDSDSETTEESVDDKIK